MAQDLVFDPVGEDAGNAPLAIFDGSGGIEIAAHAYPAPPLEVQWASSVDTEGDLPASRRYGNRTISLTLECRSEDALRALQAKIAKIGAEGGTLRWTLPNDEVIVFDLLAFNGYEPRFDVAYHINGGAFCEVELGLLAKPFGRGEEVALSTQNAPAFAPLVFTEATIAGDVPALGHLRVTNPGDYPKTCLVWGLRSRHYDSASSAALFYQAEAASTVNGALATGPAGASGGASNNTLLHSNPGTTGATTCLFNILRHHGSYRVYARVYVSGSGVMRVRARWAQSVPGKQIVNEERAVADPSGAAVNGRWVIVDLGMVTALQPGGSSRWTISFDSRAANATDDIYWDWVAFVPADEGSGILSSPDGVGGLDWSIDVTDRGVTVNDGPDVWLPTSYEGDYLFIPPSGAEGRTLEIIALLAGDPYGNESPPAVMEATNLDAFTAQLTITPRYLVVPTP